jgi:hypothetical protein
MEDVLERRPLAPETQYREQISQIDKPFSLVALVDRKRFPSILLIQ